MNKPIYVVFSGTQSVGKTTLVKATIPLLQEIYNKPVYHIAEIARKLSAQGHTINSASNSTTQRLIEDGYATEEAANVDKVLIADRSVIDRYSYTLLSKAVEDVSLVQWYEHFIPDTCAKYSHIFYIPLSEDVKLELDGVRSSDESFRKAVDTTQQMIIDKFNIKVTRLYGSTDQRLAQIKKVLQQ
jgi:thymidylate kinase